MKINQLTIVAGYDKSGNKEKVEQLILEPGNIYTIVGKTGSGKTQLMEDIESLNNGEGLTKRVIKINGQVPDESILQLLRSRLIAHLSQNMNFILDMPVLEFLTMRQALKQEPRSLDVAPNVLAMANQLAGEVIAPDQLLTKLSGGQSRALMIADVALNRSAPIVLIDEVENAGIDRLKAMNLLVQQEKIVIVVTHDPMLALQGNLRIVLDNGGMVKLVKKNLKEEKLLHQLSLQHGQQESLRHLLRNGESWNGADANAL